MTAHTVVHLWCDHPDCRDAAWGPREFIGNPGSTRPSTRETAARCGWQLSRLQGAWFDYCPDHGYDIPCEAEASAS